MKKINLTEEELATMSYDDVASVILENNGKKMKTPDLFKEVIKVMNLPESDFETHIADFFELLSTDKRFIMIEKGFWDLKLNHSTKIVIEDDEDEDDIIEVEEVLEKTEEDELEEINYDEEILDDDETEDELKDLVIMDDPEENEIM